MEKVKLTKAQAEAVEYFERVFVKNKESSMSNETLRKALNHGYEVLSEFKENDYVTNTETGITIKLDESKAYFLNNSYIHKDRIRHATQEEIQQEKERRRWAKIGRNVNDYKTADVVTCDNVKGLWEVMGCAGDNSTITNNFADSEIHVKTNLLKMVCPVENRLDVSAE